MRKPLIVIGLMASMLLGPTSSHAQTAHLSPCGKVGRAASWIMYIGYRPDESAQSIFERARGPEEADEMFAQLPWDHSQVLGMIKQIQAVDVYLDGTDDAMRQVFEYGRYFEYQCLQPEVEFVPFAEAISIIDRCIDEHDSDVGAVAKCAQSRLPTGS